MKSASIYSISNKTISQPTNNLASPDGRGKPFCSLGVPGTAKSLKRTAGIKLRLRSVQEPVDSQPLLLQII